MITRRLDVYFSRKAGKVKPVHGMLGIPLKRTTSEFSMSDIYKDLSVPAVMFSSRPGEGCIPIDLHKVFPDLSLDERFYESYNFSELDKALNDVKSIGAEIVLRLGETPLPIGERGYIRLPMSFERMAYIFCRIIAHCNTGFAGGMKLGVKRIEIWQSPDNDFGFFKSNEEYFELYRVVAQRIKEDFPRIKVGAYSSGGFVSLNHVDGSEREKKYVSYLESFLAYIKRRETSAPLDFLSWMCTPETPEELSLHSNYARSYLNHYGFKKAESIVSSFAPLSDTEYNEYRDKRYPALLASCLITAAKSDISAMFYAYSHPDSPKNALYSFDDRMYFRKYASYNVMRAFGTLGRGASVVETSEDYRREIYSLATVSDEAGYVIIATRDYEGVLELATTGHKYTTYSIEGILGGGERGAGFSTRAENVSFDGKIKLRVGRDEVYILTLK